MTMEESILKTANLYNKVMNGKAFEATFHRFIGKLLMYRDVKGKDVTYTLGIDGRISTVTFGEDVREVE